MEFEFEFGFDGPSAPVEQLVKAAATNLRRRGYSRPIPRLSLARALMDVLNRPDAPSPDADFDQLRSVVAQLADPPLNDPDAGNDTDTGNDPDTEDTLFRLFVNASGASRFEERWAALKQASGSSLLHPDLRAIENPMIGSSLRAVAGEIATRIETSFVVRLEEEEDPDLQKIACSMLPYNWPMFGDFFCELSRGNEEHSRDGDVVGATGGELSVDTPHWCGVYQERVGGCPDGWFPQTFLLFTWDRYQDQLILRYELVPRRGDDRTVLRIDEGYIQVNRLHHAYEVSTLKYLLFDDRFISGGGQALAAMAPELGWLDYAINQFSSCAMTNPPPSVPGIVTPEQSDRKGIDAGFQRILDRLQTQLQDSVKSADAQFDTIKRKVNEGEYGLNDFVGDWGEAALRAMRDTSRVVLNEVDFARESLRLAKLAVTKKGNRS
ncbi:MAG: hypothetical protein ACRDRX_04050 [Pseudonocardiaceae bacterium]